MNAAEWAEAQRRKTALDALIAQLADREAEKEHDLSAACDDCALDRDQVPEPETGLARRPTLRHRPASRRRSRGR
ncbi:hypothetical protein [Streptomyces lancefieldiae]|uniref:Conjugal transfer protein TraR n=1 Tax=Streptomyces lancefieldiae TaxID=3075520 RepID=A0ABU3B1W4_9ACTN|nr:hypothetical protein [Streptomyces sp. DSM 40712]MDT0614971.1 hypothetical protein [Streptomyces sp. DSM 40712]